MIYIPSTAFFIDLAVVCFALAFVAWLAGPLSSATLLLTSAISLLLGAAARLLRGAR